LNPKTCAFIDAPTHSLKDSNVNPKVKTIEGVGVHSLACNSSRVEGRARAPRWGLGQIISGSIIHRDLYKPNNTLVSAWLQHFLCTNNPQTYTYSTNSQDSP